MIMPGISLLDLEAGYPDSSRMEKCGVEDGRKEGGRDGKEGKEGEEGKKAKKGKEGKEGRNIEYL